MDVYIYLHVYILYIKIQYVNTVSTYVYFFLLDTSPVEPSSSSLMETNPLEWPERHVFQNLETFEKAKQKMR